MQDYGYDLIIFTYNAYGEIENGHIYVQLKATDTLKVLSDGKTMFEDSTYSELEKFLLKLEFKNLPIESNHIVLWHSTSGALIILPHYEPQAKIRPIHQILIRRILTEYGLIEEGINYLLDKIPS